MVYPHQAPHEVGFLGQVTRVERAAGSTVALHIDTRALPSNAGGSRIAVLSTLLAAVLAVAHGLLGLCRIFWREVMGSSDSAAPCNQGRQ